MAQASNPSFVLVKANEVRYEDRPVPEIQDPHDVIVDVRFTGICGSDVHFWSDGRLGTFVVEAPMTLGHESAGIIHAVGPAVKTLKPGDHVAMEPGVPCRRCPDCKSGSYHLCTSMAFAATPPVDGTLCRYYRLPADFCYALPAHVPLACGAVVEPMAVAVHAVRQAGVRAGDTVVVYGAGPVGLLCAAVARSAGARSLVLVDTNPDRLAFARDWVPGGCGTLTAQAESPRDAAARLRSEHADRLGPRGADVVLEATGAAPCTQAAVQVVRPGGTVVQVGIGPTEVPFPISTVCSSEITFKGSFRYKEGDYAIAVGIIAQGTVDAARLITGTVAFEDAEEAYGRTKRGEGIKTLIAGPK